MTHQHKKKSAIGCQNEQWIDVISKYFYVFDGYDHGSDTASHK